MNAKLILVALVLGSLSAYASTEDKSLFTILNAANGNPCADKAVCTTAASDITCTENRSSHAAKCTFFVKHGNQLDTVTIQNSKEFVSALQKQNVVALENGLPESTLIINQLSCTRSYDGDEAGRHTTYYCIISLLLPLVK
jgi:hypothetical protein